jgi:hypothetical protein
MYWRRRYALEVEAAEAERQRDASEEYGGGQSRQNLLAADGLIRMHWRRAEQSEHWNVLQADEASEALEVVACIGGAQRWTELLGLTEPEVSTKRQRWSKWSELIRRGWNLSGVTSAACRT